MAEFPQRFFLSLPAEARAPGPLLAPGLPMSPCLLSYGAVGLWREYPLDDDAVTWRVSPIFPSARAAVRWLAKASPTWKAPIAESRFAWWPEYDGYVDPRTTAITFQLAAQYGMWAYDLLAPNFVPRLTVVFRGQRDAHWGLLPRLYQVLVEPGLSAQTRQQWFVDECNKATRFVEGFFSEPNVRALFPDLFYYGTPTRAAIARHYGYHSQFIDFTTDPGIAAFFATQKQHWSAERPRFGAIWYLAESELRRFFELEIGRTPHFEHRSFLHRSIDRLRRCLADGRPEGTIAWAGVLQEWERVAWSAASRKVRAFHPAFPDVLNDVEFSISTYYTPGPGIPRMNAQLWCAVEVNSHLGPGKVSAIGEGLDWHRLLEVLAGRVVFIQKGGPYRRPGGGYWWPKEVSEATILPPDDRLLKLVQRYQETVDERPW